MDEGDALMVPLSAKGIGTTMQCKQDISIIDLGPQLTNNPFERTIVLENKGRRHQALRWINKTNVEDNLLRVTKKGTSRKPLEPIFTVTPVEITLRPRTATAFVFSGSSKEPGLLREMFVLESKIGKESKFRAVIETEVKVQVVNPFLEISERELSFEYVWEQGVECVVQRQTLYLTNVSALNLNFTLRTETPFNLSDLEFSLAPGEKSEVTVEFDPIYTDDKRSHIVEKMIEIVYRRHPFREYVKLKGEIVFPNLAFETMDVNFGCILNDTSKRVKVKVTNSTRIPAAFEW